MAQTVLITGAAGALGSAVARKFLSSGVEVLGAYHSAHSKGSDLFQAKGLSWVPMDVSDSKSVSDALKPYVRIDGLVHCAGGFRYLKTEQASDADLDFLLDTNLRSALILSRELIPRMKQNGYGRIVFISSKATLNPPAGMGAYAAAKAGLNMLTASLADEVKSLDINVNAVLPSIIDTPANRKDMPKADFSSWVTPEALAEIIFSLTQPWGKPIHGALIPVAGRV